MFIEYQFVLNEFNHNNVLGQTIVYAGRAKKSNP